MTTQDTVLIIDDDHAIRVTLRDILERSGYAVFSAADGNSAFELLRLESCNPDIILLDLMMPLMNGWDFLKKIEKIESLKGVPILVMSAAKNKTNFGLDYTFIPKPLQLEDLLTTIASLIKSAGSDKPYLK